MSSEATLLERCQSQCELCSADAPLTAFTVPPHNHVTVDHAIMVCEQCLSEIEKPQDINHWRCLNDSMWSPLPAVQVTAWRQLTRLNSESWAQDLLDMMYMEEDTKNWALIGMSDDDKHLDSNGVELEKGDDVTIIKDLPVKGSSMVVKQGTVVRGIGLAQDDPALFSGKVDGQSIWLRCEFCRKK
ncbi:PhnA domain-containing protein [Vibrio ostreicida]|uniref:PhnA domain-containing protein n=1 Tax=Vibrio ostreicida TaxID=526588 RepID=UPI000970FDF4|nr:alkylphosphonate utilization protein [Vibrio ostreicida]